MPSGAGDPEGAADDPAVAAVQLRVVRVAGPQSALDRVEDGALESGLVALDEQEVVRVRGRRLLRPGDVVRGVALGVGGVGGDDRVRRGPRSPAAP